MPFMQTSGAPRKSCFGAAGEEEESVKPFPNVNLIAEFIPQIDPGRHASRLGRRVRIFLAGSLNLILDGGEYNGGILKPEGVKYGRHCCVSSYFTKHVTNIYGELNVSFANKIFSLPACTPSLSLPACCLPNELVRFTTL